MFVLESYNTVLYSLFITMLASRGSEGVMKSFPIEVTFYFAFGCFLRTGTGFIDLINGHASFSC